LATLDLTVVVRRLRALQNQLLVEALMISLAVIVGREFERDLTQMLLAEDDELVETLAPDGGHKSLGGSVEIWAAWGQAHGLYAAVADQSAKLRCEYGGRVRG